jgi:hypothetical protein
MIRIRRCHPKGVFRRRRYEVELVEPATGEILWQGETTTPVTAIDRHIGVREAWALVHAADKAWDEGSWRWISLPGTPE